MKNNFWNNLKRLKIVLAVALLGFASSFAQGLPMGATSTGNTGVVTNPLGQAAVGAGKAAKAKTLLTNLVESNPQGIKACPSMYKLATIYGKECNLDRKKQYLQMIISSNTCASTPELEQAALALQEMLDFKSTDGRTAEDICREQMR